MHSYFLSHGIFLCLSLVLYGLVDVPLTVLAVTAGHLWSSCLDNTSSCPFILRTLSIKAMNENHFCFFCANILAVPPVLSLSHCFTMCLCCIFLFRQVSATLLCPSVGLFFSFLSLILVRQNSLHQTCLKFCIALFKCHTSFWLKTDSSLTLKSTALAVRDSHQGCYTKVCLKTFILDICSYIRNTRKIMMPLFTVFCS